MKKIVIILFLFSTFLHAQIIENAFKPASFAPSILNMNKLDMRHSVSFSTGFSSNNDSFYRSVYTNHLQYNFNSKFNIKLDLNFVNQGSGYVKNWEFDSNNDNRTMVLPNMQLNFKPTENTLIRIEYNQYNTNPFYR